MSSVVEILGGSSQPLLIRTLVTLSSYLRSAWHLSQKAIDDDDGTLCQEFEVFSMVNSYLHRSGPAFVSTNEPKLPYDVEVVASQIS